MFRHVDTRVPGEVETQVHAIYRKLFPSGERAFVPRAFEWATNCFTGKHDGYLPVDALYHDFEHTLQGTLCLARLLHGRHTAQVAPELDAKTFELGLLAILFHDTGYLKKQGDAEGTGAKYTLIHVTRSTLFAREFLLQKGYSDPDITSIQNMIRCTGVNADLKSIRWKSELEKIVAYALGTADLLGQMAAHDYVGKLPILYQEFAEASRLGGDGASRLAYEGAEELMRTTPAFWEKYVLPKIRGDFENLSVFLNIPYPSGPNLYIERIEENIRLLRQHLAGIPVVPPATSKSG